MSNLFLISDHHMGHSNILSFLNKDGEKLRPFQTVEEMDEYIIEKHNSVVRSQDKVYFGGDFTMRDSCLSYLKRMNGHKRLVAGNHDFTKVRIYADYFENICSSRILDRMLLTHIPIHPDSIGRNKINIFGHTHDNKQGTLGPKYFCMCAEALNYTPISLEDVKKKAQDQIGETW